MYIHSNLTIGTQYLISDKTVLPSVDSPFTLPNVPGNVA